MSSKIALGLVTDLFFRSKLDAVAESLGVEVRYASTLDAAARHCASRHPALVFADLSDAAFPAAETAARIRADAPGARIIGFASHVDLKSLKAAREAGFDLTLSRSEFTARLADLLRL
jgi:DNA-binding NarL/FixJ family response regulator